MNKLFILLGNQLFHPDYLKDYKDHYLFLAEDYNLCTYEKHHKQKIIFFLSSMRSYCDEIKKTGFNVIYYDLEDKKFKKNYTEKLKSIIFKKYAEPQMYGLVANIPPSLKSPMPYTLGDITHSDESMNISINQL